MKNSNENKPLYIYYNKGCCGAYSLCAISSGNFGMGRIIKGFYSIVKKGLAMKYVYRNGFHFVGKFYELITYLRTIENKNITLAEYILLYKQQLN
ncbi:MAG: hypothetical protein PHC45_02930 [Clostridiaceae bacterium]|nr:hypothetical protein [Clostridiaceae bacterium]